MRRKGSVYEWPAGDVKAQNFNLAAPRGAAYLDALKLKGALGGGAAR
jgi:hypothetical protein